MAEIDGAVKLLLLEGRPAMVEGFMDGYDLDAPEPSGNRSHSYRHGFANGRDDRRGKPRASAEKLLKQAELAMLADEYCSSGKNPPAHHLI